MISYKKINILDITLSDNIIKNKDKDDELEIKSPIMLYEINNNKLYLNINANSELHIVFLNICGYISRLFRIKQFDCCFLTEKKIIINIVEDSKFYNENSKTISIKNIKSDGKMICSFVCSNGELKLKKFLLIS